MTALLLRRRRLGLTSCRGIATASETGITYARTDQRRRWPVDLDLIIRWGCTANIPIRNVLNSAEAIHRVNDKAGFRRVMMESENHQPGELCPITYFDTDFATEFDDIRVIVRPASHAQGRRFYIANNYDDLRLSVARCWPNWYASEIIDKVAEYRVFVCQGRAVWVARKTPGNPDAIAWNVARGGRFDNVSWGDWPLKAVRVSIEAFNLSGLDFGGVDVIVDRNNNCYVLEINSAPSQTSEYRQSCTAKAFDYIVRNGKDAIPLIPERGGYLKFVHPAICERALIP